MRPVAGASHHDLPLPTSQIDVSLPMREAPRAGRGEGASTQGLMASGETGGRVSPDEEGRPGDPGELRVAPRVSPDDALAARSEEGRSHRLAVRSREAALFSRDVPGARRAGGRVSPDEDMGALGLRARDGSPGGRVSPDEAPRPGSLSPQKLTDTNVKRCQIRARGGLHA